MGIDDASIYLVIAATFFGFIGLAWILLYPVYRFMKRQERLADDWTDDAIRQRVAKMRAQKASAEKAEGSASDG
ncbi:MAG: hypothetical protein AAGK21_10720 [Bacteroidota bacterium]